MALDAVVVGAGPNGLAAAITLARAGLSVQVREAAAVPGGGTRTEALTLPGFRHDVCSAVHPLAIASPPFRSFELERHGLRWIHPDLPLAHPLEGDAAELDRSLDRTADALGDDGPAWRELVGPATAAFDELLAEWLGPLHLPRRPLALARFGLDALRSAERVARRFRTERARALWAGLAAHSGLPLDRAGTAGFGLVLAAAAHAVGWPIPAGGADAIARALVAVLRESGGELVLDAEVTSLAALPPSRAVLLDLTPRQVLRVAGDRLPRSYRKRLSSYRYGPGACKVDWALAAPIPWEHLPCRRAGTVHVGGTWTQIDLSERLPWEGRTAPRPYVLVSQPTLSDPSRAPPGKHVAWAYCHVPHGSAVDVSHRIEEQLERYAPGFRERILARHVFTAPDLERHDANLVGGDVNGGSGELRQLFARPVASLDPYATPVDGLYLCSASTPPGGGVHGLCGALAARSCLRRTFGRRIPRRGRQSGREG